MDTRTRSKNRFGSSAADLKQLKSGADTKIVGARASGQGFGIACGEA